MFVYLYTSIRSVVSENLSQSVLCLGLTIFMLGVHAIIKVYLYNNSLPPGPWGFPYVGSFFSLNGQALHVHYKSMVAKYGSVFSTRFGSQLIVVLSDYKTIRDAFRKDDLTGRPNTVFNKILEGYGIINTEGKLWKDQRRFISDRLRSFGMTYFGSRKNLMESRIAREVHEYLRSCNNQSINNEPIDFSPMLSVHISNVICDIVMSVRFTYDDLRFKRFMNLIEEGFKLFGSIESAVFIPIIRCLPGHFKTCQKIYENRKEMGEFFQETIDNHRKTFDPSNIRDLVDSYLLEIEKSKAEGTSAYLFEGRDHDRQMQQIIGDLFSAGMETIKTTLLWSKLYMLHYPEVMAKVQNELDEVVGNTRIPMLEDLPYLPYTEATICEIMRISSIIPMGTTHAPTKDISLNGFNVPHYAQVVPLLHAVHMDPTLWKDPETFEPSRFINENGKVQKPEYFIPFGVGRRMCLGEVLARMEIFLFFASFMHSFHPYIPEGQELPSLKGIAGITICPNAYTIYARPRHNKKFFNSLTSC